MTNGFRVVTLTNDKMDRISWFVLCTHTLCQIVLTNFQFHFLMLDKLTFLRNYYGVQSSNLLLPGKSIMIHECVSSVLLVDGQVNGRMLHAFIPSLFSRVLNDSNPNVSSIGKQTFWFTAVFYLVINVVCDVIKLVLTL